MAANVQQLETVLFGSSDANTTAPAAALPVGEKENDVAVWPEMTSEAGDAAAATAAKSKKKHRGKHKGR